MFQWLGRRTKKLANSASHKAAVPMMKRLYYFLHDLFVAIFMKREKGEVLTFEQAMTQYKLTEADLVERKKSFQIQLIIYVLGSIFVAGYTFYLIKSGYWISVSLSVVLLAYLILSALKSHFWIFQIKKRKLGCSIQEWLSASIKETN